MSATKLIGVASAAAFGATAALYGKYRREIREIRTALASGSQVAATAAGPIEYAEKGRGEPLLLIHGAGGGYDQGLLIGRDFADGHRVITPSRFGYLRTPVPNDPSPAAQADAHAALLDHLSVPNCIVMGVSAGAPSAIEFALRHPDRTSALILLVPRTFDPSQSIGVDHSLDSQMVLRLVESSADFLFWLAIKFSRASVVRFLGVPPELEAKASDGQRARVTAVLRSILPLSSRIRGIQVDSSAVISEWPLDQIRVPTLIVSARDDLFKTLPGARFTAERIAGAELRVLESGGHLMLGQESEVHRLICDFLARRGRRRAPGINHTGTPRQLAAA